MLLTWLVKINLLFRDWTFSTFYFWCGSVKSTHWYDSNDISDISFDWTSSKLVWFFISKLIIKKSFVCRRGWSNSFVVSMIIKYGSNEVGAWSFRTIQLSVEPEPDGWTWLINRIIDFENHIIQLKEFINKNFELK